VQVVQVIRVPCRVLPFGLEKRGTHQELASFPPPEFNITLAPEGSREKEGDLYVESAFLRGIATGLRGTLERGDATL